MERIKLDEFLQYHFLSNVRLSPNAKKAAFVVSRANEAKDGYDAGIWTVDLETRQCRQLTAGKDERSFVWLDDQTILFTSKRDSKKEDVDSFYTDCFQISLTGGEARKVMTLPAPVEALEKLDDDTWLLCVDYDGSLPEDFFLMSRESRKKLLADRKKEKDYSVFTELPFWRNGGGVTDKKRDRLYLYHVKAQELEPITGPLYLMLDYSVSADKKHLLYVGSEFKGLQSLKQELVEVDLATGEADVLIPVSSWDIHHAEYAGDKILVTATENREYGINENADLYCYDREQRALELILSPDRSWYSSVGSDCRLGGGKSMVAEEDGVTYITTERNWSKINHTDYNGHVTSLTADEGSVDCMDKKGEALVYVAMRKDQLQELYCLTEQGEVQLSHINERIFEKKSVVTPKPLRITNDDGVEIDGWVLEPVGYDESKSYPAILDIHGGPKTVYGTCFMHEMQYWANEGYFVFFCNPRGGDGRGNDFADIRGRYGQEDYEDIRQEPHRRHRRQLRRLYDQLDHRPHPPLCGGGLAAVDLQLDLDGGHLGHRPVLRARPGRRQRLGAPGPGVVAFAAQIRRQVHHPDAVHPLGRGLPLLDGGGAADVLGAQGSRHRVAGLPVPRREPRALPLRQARAPHPPAQGDHRLV